MKKKNQRAVLRDKGSRARLPSHRPSPHPSTTEQLQTPRSFSRLLNPHVVYHGQPRSRREAEALSRVEEGLQRVRQFRKTTRTENSVNRKAERGTRVDYEVFHRWKCNGSQESRHLTPEPRCDGLVAKDASKNWGELFPEPEGMQSATMSRIRIKRIQVIIIVAATTLFIACTTLLVFLLWAFTRPAIQFCNTRDCLRHILELKEAMNTSVNPCEDFYQFTCGTWKLHHREKSTVARVFDHSTEIAIKEMQEGSIAKAVVPKALEYFRNCILERDMTPAEAEVFIDFKHQLGLFWPEKPQAAIDALLPLLNMTITWNINLLFHLRALPAYKRRPQTLYIRRGILKHTVARPQVDT
ncbi:hypothetical protein HPB51_019625 [Rhipicephalus microplus]|uniref:M13 family peptidase n=1 Tax=Rhipicephalus microplus TaxID=6941 RepID=A0A9J6F7Y2_RHIMP|nr:hypothetical protein HPB51_019625 [Rhipicephalus microplus]